MSSTVIPKTDQYGYKKELTRAGLRHTPNNTDFEPRESVKWRRVPTERLKMRLKVTDYDKPSHWVTEDSVKPPKVNISTKQHIGVPSIPTVNLGDRVKRGQVIGVVPKDKLGCYIHASIDGIVIESDEDKIVIQGEGL